MLDDSDRRILRHMQAEPEMPAAQLAERAGVTSSTLARRLDRMRSAGVLRGVRGVINWPALGYEVDDLVRTPQREDNKAEASKPSADASSPQTPSSGT